MEIPIEQVLLKLDLIIRSVNSLKNNSTTHKRIVDLTSFSEYSGYKKPTIYSKLSNGESIPGAFKSEGSNKWYFDLNEYDEYIEKMKNRYKNV